MNLITPDSTLPFSFLYFKPIELDGLKREITEAGIKCSMEKLMNYLDEKVIIQNEC